MQKDGGHGGGHDAATRLQMGRWYGVFCPDAWRYHPLTSTSDGPPIYISFQLPTNRVAGLERHLYFTNTKMNSGLHAFNVKEEELMRTVPLLMRAVLLFDGSLSEWLWSDVVDTKKYEQRTGHL